MTGRESGMSFLDQWQSEVEQKQSNLEFLSTLNWKLL